MQKVDLYIRQHGKVRKFLKTKNWFELPVQSVQSKVDYTCTSYTQAISWPLSQLYIFLKENRAFPSMTCFQLWRLSILLTLYTNAY